MRFFATPPTDGALCDYVTIGAAFAHPVPDTISEDAAAFCEPLSVGIPAVRKAAVTGGIQAVRPAGLDAMVTGRFPLKKAADALNSDRIPGSTKAVVQVS